MHADGLERCSSCYIPTSWIALPLLARREYNHDSSIYTFGLPEGQSLELPVCACVLMKAPGRGRKDGAGAADFDGTDAVRPYTPISDNSMLGQFELLVKRYDNGAASQYLHSLTPGEATVEFKHIVFNIKAQYPFEGKKSFTMLCGGTGIAPIYQALWKLLGTAGDDRPVTVIYSNKTPEDILMREELELYASKHPDRLRLVHIIGETPDSAPPSGWESTPLYVAEAGWLDDAKLRKYAFPPADDTLVFVCGVPGYYDTLCGPRGEKAIKKGSLLHQLGYTAEMVSKM